MRVGVFQSACSGMTLEERTVRLGEVIRDADVDVVVCPELFVSGYNVGDDHKSLADLPTGKHFELISPIAQETGTCILYGYPERDGTNLYNSAACVSPDGKLLVNHRKRANSPGSFEEDYFTPANHATLFTHMGVNIGIVICYEVEFPETVRELASRGAHLVAVPTALVDNWSVVAEKVIPARAFENGVWLAYANHAGTENGFNYLGGSRIVAPDGREVAVAGSAEELIVAEIDVDAVTAAQSRLPYLRDYKRFNR